MRARENARLRTKSGEPASKSRPSRRLPAVHDQAANGFFLDVIERVLENELGDLFRAEFFDQLLADFFRDRFDGRFAGEFCRSEQAPEPCGRQPALWLPSEFLRERC